MPAKLLVAFPQFRVADVAKSAEYYRDALGFRIGEYAGDPPVFVHVSRDYVVLQLGLAQDAETASRGPGRLGHNAYIWTDDIDLLADEFRARGVDIVEGPVDRVYACRELLVRDCNGLVLCFAKRRE